MIREFKIIFKRLNLLDRQLFGWFVFCFAFAYLVPGSLIHDIQWLSNYVHWFMEKHPMCEYIAVRSIDPDGYRLFFAVIVWFIPFLAIAYYFKPIEFNFVLIQSNKYYYIIGWSILMPMGLYFIHVAFQQENYEPTFFVVERMERAAEMSRVMFVLIYGGIAGFYGVVSAAIVTWYKNIRDYL